MGHLYEASGVGKIGIDASYKTGKVYETIGIQISLIGRIALVTLSHMLLNVWKCIKLLNYSTYYLNAFTKFFVKTRSLFVVVP